MLKQIRFELFKMSRRPRTYLGSAAFLFINLAVMAGLKYGDISSMVTRQASHNGFGIVGSPANAEFMAWLVVASPFIAVPILTMFMPFFISLVFGEIFAGENTDGTLRAVLTRPITRASLFWAKLISVMIYALALVFSLGVLAYLIGLITFGRGGLMAMTWLNNSPSIAWYGEAEGLQRLLLSYLFTTVGMTVVGMIAFVIGIWLNNALGAIGASIMMLFTMFIVGEITYFKPIKHYLFTTHLDIGQKVFADPIPWNDIWHSIVILGVYIVSLVAISMLIFRRKDILT